VSALLEAEARLLLAEAGLYAGAFVLGDRRLHVSGADPLLKLDPEEARAAIFEVFGIVRFFEQRICDAAAAAGISDDDALDAYYGAFPGEDELDAQAERFEALFDDPGDVEIAVMTQAKYRRLAAMAGVDA
jgi:hypothetical protein